MDSIDGTAGREPGGPEVVSPELRHLRDWADSMPVLWSFVSADLRYRFNNAGYETWFGIPREEIAGRKVRDVLGEEVFASIRPQLDAALAGRTVEFDTRLPLPDGGHRWVHGVFTPSKDEHGVVLGFYVLVMDLSERLRMAGLRSGQARVLELIATGRSLDEVLDALVRMIEEQSTGILASVLLVDESGQRLRHGAAPTLPEEFVRAIDGIPVAEGAGACGTSAFRGEPVIVADTMTDPLFAAYRDLTRALGLRACWSHPISSVDGGVLGTFALYCREARPPNPHELDLMETAANIAKIAIERGATEQALLGEQARMQILMDNLPHAIFFKDRESRFTRVNRAQAGYLSLASPGDAIGRTDSEFFAPEVARRYADDEKAVMATGEPLVNRLEHDGREGDDRRWFLTTKVPIRDADGAIMGTAGIAREVTEKHRLEEALRASHDELEARVRERTLELSQLNENLKVEIEERQRAEERSRGHDAELAHVARLSTLGVMAAALSHELNQPLQAIANYADTCRRWLSRPDPDLDRLRDDLTTIGRLSDRTGEIMGKLRGVFDRTPARETADRINEVVLEIVPALEFAGRRRAVEIRLELADHLPPCRVYRLQMQLVLLTLGHNAIDAMEGLPADERVLTISTDRAGDGGVEIRVRDRGPGLSPDLADRAFEPFFSSKSTGMGLGLALASRLVEAQGGTLDLGSGDGPGACFVVRLPDTGARDPV